MVSLQNMNTKYFSQNLKFWNVLFEYIEMEIPPYKSDSDIRTIFDSGVITIHELSINELNTQ